MKLDSTFFRFVIVGAISVAADFVVLQTLVALGLPPLAANALSFPAGISTNYALHRAWTFKSSAPVQREFTHFLGVSLMGVIISQIVVATWVAAGSSYLSGKLVSIFVVFLWNYALNRGWVFS